MWNKQTRKRTPSVLLACLCFVACEAQREPDAPPAASSQATKESVLQQRISRDPADLAAQLELAHHYFDTERRPQAIPLYVKVLAQRPDDPDIRTDLATSLFDARRLAEARVEYERVIRKHPEHLKAVFNLAVLSAAEGKSEAAAQLWEKAATLTKNAGIASQARQLAADARKKAAAGSGK